MIHTRLGEVNKNRYGTEMIIIEYKNYKNIKVKFNDKYGYEVNSIYGNFKIGNIGNPYDRSIYNVGYIGEGKFTPSINKKMTPQYIRWSNMFRRCYCADYYNKHTTYKNCVVCDEWHNFQKFASWYDQNYYACNEEIHLDKDILCKGNKIYSPEFCVFIPQALNKLLTKSNKIRGNTPIGIIKRNNYYEVKCGEGNKNPKYIGVFKNENDAFYAYKSHKEKIIKEMANKYKEIIPYKVYLALLKYTVEITD